MAGAHGSTLIRRRAVEVLILIAEPDRKAATSLQSNVCLNFDSSQPLDGLEEFVDVARQVPHVLTCICVRDV